MRIRRRYSLERGSGISDAHIERFCDCYTPNLAVLLTEDDLRRLALTYLMPADVKEKAQYATLWCKRLVPMLYLPTVTRPSGYSNIISDDLPKLNASPNGRTPEATR